MKKHIFFLLTFLVTTVFSQENRPKIGLVLSGGGAKGLAHIGVLEYIEKSEIQIDYIGGTSMGAIVGGLYAAGYNVEQIKDLVSKIDFTPLLQDQFPRNALPFFEKEFGDKHAFSLPVTKNRIQIPKAVSKGQNVLDLLTYLLSPVDSIQDFSKLPIPFFCIATNVENGKQVLLEKGFLPLALRASGAFPTLLNSVEIEGQILIDGGVANNFPVDIMKSKGIDYIIGVDVQKGLSRRGDLNSAVSILNQIVSYDVYRKREERIKQIDLYIQPDISEYSVVDFAKAKQMILKGEEAAKAHILTLDSISKSQKNKALRKPLHISKKPLFVNLIEVKGSKKFTSAYVKGKLNLQRGDSVTLYALKEKMDFLSATNNYERVDYRVKKDSTKNHLIFYVKETDQKAFLRLGAHYDLLYESAILANYNHKGLLIKNDQLSFDAILGDNLRYNLNYFVDNGFYISYGFKSRYNHFKTNTPFNTENSTVNSISLNYQDITNEFFVQTTFNRKFALGLSTELKTLNITTETLVADNERVTFDNSTYFNLKGYLKLDTYDKRHLPTKGFFADIEGRWYASSSDYNNNFQSFAQLSGTLGFATTFCDKLTFHYTNEAGFSFDNPTSDVFDFYLGGYNENYINTFYRFYGYEFAGLTGNSFLRSEFTFRYKIYGKHHLSVLANYARVEDNVFKNIQIFRNSLSGYAVGYGLETFLGPVEFKYSWSPDTKKHFWLFNLGFWF